MKKAIQFWFDYYLKEFWFGPFKEMHYQEWMWNKWGDRYSERYIRDVYVDVNGKE